MGGAKHARFCPFGAKGLTRQIRAKFSFQVLLTMKLYWIWLMRCSFAISGTLVGGFDKTLAARRGWSQHFERLLNHGWAPPSRERKRWSMLPSWHFIFSVDIFERERECKERTMKGTNTERETHTRNKRKRKASFCS